MAEVEGAARASQRILMVGTFDVQNYGDLLFPLVARHRLGGSAIDVVPVSPTSLPTGMPDALAPQDIRQMLSGEGDFDAIVVGGGYIIHTHTMDFLEEYRLGGVGDWAAAGLWLGATLAAALRDIPIVWNAPGVPHPFGARQRGIVEAALRATDYVSVRDSGGAELLAAPADVPVQIVPDSIAELARLWPQSTLAQCFGDFLERKDGNSDARYLVVHLRDRSLAGVEMSALAAMLEDFAREQELVPILVAIGPSLDDSALARTFSEHLQIRHILLDDPLSLREITSVLAHAALYLGASMHGYIAAAAYGVPGLMVARPAYRKFAGFLEHTGRTEDFVRDWPEALLVGGRRAKEGRKQRIPDSVFGALDAHWAKIRAGVSDPGCKRAARGAFLNSVVGQGLKSGGPGWALRPVLGRGVKTQPTTRGGTR